jgi:Tfp pilus assembly protein PilW
MRSAFSLIELLVAQVIALIVVAGLLSLFVPTVQALAQNEGSVESQVRLREASHLLLRDLQGLGGAEGGSGALFVVLADGGAGGADRFRVFRRDHTVCTENLAEPGVMAVTTITPAAETATLGLVTGVCPLTAASCTAAAVVGRRMFVRSSTGAAIPLEVTAVDPGACTMTFGAAANLDAVTAYNRVFTPAVASYSALLTQLASGGANSAKLVVGSTFEYRVVGEALQRSVNGDAFETVMPEVFDIQVVPIYDLNTNDTIDAGERNVANAVGFSANAFFGAEISIVTFSKAKGGIVVAPPALIANRNLAAAPADRRYAASTILIAARNQ